MARQRSIKDLLERAFEPLRAFAERIDAQIERRQLAPAMAVAVSPPKRATTSTLSLTAPSPPPTTAGLAPRAAAPRAARPAPVPLPARAAARAPTVLLEGPGGEFFELPASTAFTAQASTQVPGGAPVVSQFAATLSVASDGTVGIRDDARGPYLEGRTVAVERDGRATTLTVNYTQSGQIGQGTLFVGFAAGRLSYLGGSGTVRDEAGRSAVRDLSAAFGRQPARGPSGLTRKSSRV